jgi:hypothetical protein
MSENITKLNDLVVDLTVKLSKLSTITNEVDELRKSTTMPHSVIGFKPSLITFQAIPTASSLLDGVISYLTKRHGGNVHDRGIVCVFADRAYNGEAHHAAKNAADLKADSCFHSANDSDQLIGFDFREMMRIMPSHYSVRSNGRQPNCSHLRSSVVEISNNKKRWEVVDRRTDCPDLNDKFAVQCFVIQTRPKTEIRYIRLRQTGVNWSNGHYLVICGFEIFGQLKIREKQQI